MKIYTSCFLHFRLGVLIFTILPLIFMISMAFTNYSKVDSHLVLFDWVGLENFKQLFDSGSSIGHSFWSVLGWTIIWAIFATGLNYILGILVALLINRKGTRFKSFWRFIFVLSIAVPQFVSLCHEKYVKSGWHCKCCIKESGLD